MQYANSPTIMQYANSPTFWLWVFFLFFSFEKKIKTQNSKISKGMHSFLPKFTTKVSYRSIPLWKKCGFRLATEKSTTLWIPFLITGMELYQDIFIKSFSLCLADATQIHLADDIGIPLQKTNTGQKSLSFFGPKL